MYLTLNGTLLSFHWLSKIIIVLINNNNYIKARAPIWVGIPGYQNINISF